MLLIECGARSFLPGYIRGCITFLGLSDVQTKQPGCISGSPGEMVRAALDDRKLDFERFFYRLIFRPRCTSGRELRNIIFA